MKKTVYVLVYVVLLVVSTAISLAPSDHYEVTTGHKIAFKSKDPSGTFKTITGTMDFDETDTSKCNFSFKIPVSSISTGNTIRDKKAQTAQWFDATTYPNITFQSTSVSKVGNVYNITGNLKIKNTSKSITIPVTHSKNGDNITFTGSFAVNRITFGVGKKSDVVPDIMNITVSVPGIKK
jgi:polyisoprenoid-binding protein YceI